MHTAKSWFAEDIKLFIPINHIPTSAIWFIITSKQNPFLAEALRVHRCCQSAGFFVFRWQRWWWSSGNIVIFDLALCHYHISLYTRLLVVIFWFSDYRKIDCLCNSFYKSNVNSEIRFFCFFNDSLLLLKKSRSDKSYFLSGLMEPQMYTKVNDSFFLCLPLRKCCFYILIKNTDLLTLKSTYYF